MKIKVKLDPKTQQTYLDLKDFEPFFNIKKVVYIQYVEEKDAIILKFYDKNKKILKPKQK